MSKRQQLVKSTFVLYLGKIPQLITLLLLPLYTRYLSKADYGTIDLITVYAVLLVSIFTLQSEMASFRFLVDARDDPCQRKRVISAGVQIGILSLVIVVIGSIVLKHFVALQHIKSIVLYMCISIVSGLFLQFARGLGKNTKYAVASLIAGTTTIIFNILLVVIFSLGVKGILISMILANFLASLYLYLTLKLYKEIDVRLHLKKLRSEMIKYSLPLVPSSIFGWIIAASDRSIIALYLGLASSGIYAVSNKFSVLFAGAVYIFTLSWSESASRHINDNDRDFYSDTFDETLKIFGSIGLMMIAFLPVYFNILVSSEFQEAYLYVPILITSVFMSAIIAYYSGIYIAKKMTGKIATTTAFAAIINLIVTLILIKFIGIYAAAIATFVSLVTLAIYRYFDIKNILVLNYNKKNLVMIIAMYIISILLCYYNVLYGNVINILLTTAFVVVLNNSTIRSSMNKILDLLHLNKINYDQKQQTHN